MSERRERKTGDNQFPKFDLRKNAGWLGDFRNIPYNIFYAIVSENDIVSADDPGRNRVTPNTGGGESLSIFIHKSVPKKFRPIVMFHELKEAELIYGVGVNNKEAHNNVVGITEEYARDLLKKPGELEAYHQWKEGLIKG